MTSDQQPARRWGRIVDVIEGGVLYTEDAERLVLSGVRMPDDPQRRAKAEALLMDMVSDRIVFYEVSGSDTLGRLKAEVWIDDLNVNGALKGHGYGD